MTFKSSVEREQFIISNLPFVTTRVLKINNGVFDEDLHSAGKIGLLKAVDGFEEDRGFQFSTYAVIYIDEQIKHALGQRAIIKPLKHRIINGEKITYEYLFKATSSLNEPVGNNLDSVTTLQDLLPDETDVENIVCSQIFTLNLLKKLEGVEKQVIVMVLEGYSQSQIAKKLGLTQVKVSRILKSIKKTWLEEEDADLEEPRIRRRAQHGGVGDFTEQQARLFELMED